jgi:hypothetical protein
VKRLTIVAAIALMVILYVTGYALEVGITLFAMELDLPGPYSDSPVAWVWFGLSMLTFFGVLLGFCHWFARRIEKMVATKGTFE